MSEQRDVRGPMWRIVRTPGYESPMVTIKPGWAADNGVETATFPTFDEAKDFAEKRWGPLYR